ncbi:DUF2771 family protein [Amycolatopsis sp. NPDC059657]|uniref:DUF2771 family protein n=1 Tax=Amycolatopsis sp. NPDC059657 TaxID=3346899 RepID=UPI00366F91D0
MRRSAMVASLAVGAALLTGCSAPGEPEVTFFADGKTIRIEPTVHCDVFSGTCKQSQANPASLKARPGKPVQISVPAEIAETPWKVIVVYANSKGELQPAIEKRFPINKQYAYTASTPNPGDQILGIEVQQPAPAVEQGKLVVEDDGTPVLVMRAFWSLQIEAAA